MKELKAKLIINLQSCNSDDEVISIIKKVLSTYTKEEVEKFIRDIVQE